MSDLVVTATEFKSKCLSLIRELERTSSSITITKRGKAVATLSPAKRISWKSPAGMWSKKVKIVGDVVNANESDAWECLRGDQEL